MTQQARISFSNWIALVALAASLIGSVVAGTVKFTRVDEKVSTHDEAIHELKTDAKETNKQIWHELNQMRRNQDETNINLKVLLGRRYKSVDSRSRNQGER